MNLFELFVKIGAKDEASEKIKKVGDVAEETAKGGISTFASKIGSGLATAAKVGVAAITTVTAAAGAMSAAFIKSTSEVAKHGDQVDKMSQKLGLSAEAYQKWDFVLGQSGADINSMAVGLKTLTNQIDNAKNGSADATKKFAKLGISMEQINSMSREELFEASIKGFQGMADSTERAALANDLFGRSGQELAPLFNTSVEQTEELLAATERYGMVMSNDAVKASAAFQDSLDVLQRTFGGLKNNLMADFLPGITLVMDGLSEIFSGHGDAGIDLIIEGIEDFVGKLSDAMPKVLEMGGEILEYLIYAIQLNLPKLLDSASQVILKLFEGIVSALPQIAEGAVEIIGSLTQGLLDNLPAIAESVVELIGVLADGVLMMLPQIVQLGLSLIVSLANGITENLDTLIPTIIDVVFQIVDTLTNPETLSNLLTAALDIVLALVEGLLAPETMSNLFDGIFSLVDNLIEFLTDEENLSKIITSAIQLVIAIGSGLFRARFELMKAAVKLVVSLKEAIFGIDWIKIGKDVVAGFKKGIQDAWTNLKKWFKDLFGDLIGIAKKILGIASPSKVFKRLGSWSAEGFGIGFEDAFGDVEDDIEKALDFGDVNYGVATAGSSIGSFGGADAVGGLSIVQNIYSQSMSAAELMKEALYQQEKAVYLGV